MSEKSEMVELQGEKCVKENREVRREAKAVEDEEK